MQQIYVQELEFGKQMDWKQLKTQKLIFLTALGKNKAQITYISQDNVEFLPILLNEEVTRPGNFISIASPLLKKESHMMKLYGIIEELNLKISPTMLGLARKSFQSVLSSITPEKLHSIAYPPQASSTKAYVYEKTEGKYQKALISHTGKKLVFEFCGPPVPSSHPIVKRKLKIFPILCIDTNRIQRVLITIKGELLE